jgi:predicted secreted protein
MHNRSNKRCRARIYAVFDQLEANRVEFDLDYIIQLPPILDPEPDPDLELEVHDTRPIWPVRVEIIYRLLCPEGRVLGQPSHCSTKEVPDNHRLRRIKWTVLQRSSQVFTTSSS